MQLILHGHRHYPCLYTLRLQDSHGQPKTIVIAGAGSATKAPGKWPYCSYNWIRVFPDRRVEVTILRREPHSPTFTRQLDAFSATTGDFVCDRLERKVVIDGGFGDVRVETRIQGLRVLPGAPPVSRLPFEAAGANLGTYRATLTNARREVARVQWQPASGFLKLPFSLSSIDGAVHCEVVYYLHGTVPRDHWEATQLRGFGQPVEGGEAMHFDTAFPARKLVLEVLLPPNLPPGRADKRSAHWLAPAGPARQQALRWSAAPRSLSTTVDDPAPGGRLQLRWPLPTSRFREAERHREWSTMVLAMQLWQRALLDRVQAGERPLDDLCTELAAQLSQLGLGNPDCAIYLPWTSDLLRAPGSEAVAFSGARLSMAGAFFRSGEVPTNWSLEFGQGIEGRAHRTGQMLLFHAQSARQATERFLETGTSAPDVSFRHPPGREFIGSLALPILPVLAANTIASRDQLDVDPRLPRLTMAVFALYAAKVEAFMALGDDKLTAAMGTLLGVLEARLWKGIYPEARQLFQAHATPETAAQS